MAAYAQIFPKVFCRVFASTFCQYRHLQRLPLKVLLAPAVPAQQCQRFTKSMSLQHEPAAEQSEGRYKDRPWDYMESEEYIEKYGSRAVWEGYRRNHKGGIPPQKTRKTCIRGDKVCGNPCPVCRDPNIMVHHQNVKLLQQFISPQTGMLYDPTRTGVCMKQQKKLSAAISRARDDGLLPLQIPHVEFSGEDYSNTHDAVGLSPPAPWHGSGESWYYWYSHITPNSQEVAKVKKIYKKYLKG